MSLLKYFTVKRKESNQTTSDCESQPQPVIETVGLAESEEIVEGVAESDAEPEEASTVIVKRRLPDDCNMKMKKTKHAVSFKESWKNGRPWLVYVHGKGMFCQSCQRHGMKPFDRDIRSKQPCKRTRLESVTDHERSAAHKSALKRDYEATQQVDVTVAIVPRVYITDMTKTFACLYHSVKQRIAHTTNLKPMLDLLEYLQVTLNQSNGPNYTSSYKNFRGRNLNPHHCP